jgi:hypothetical protein
LKITKVCTATSTVLNRLIAVPLPNIRKAINKCFIPIDTSQKLNETVELLIKHDNKKVNKKAINPNTISGTEPLIQTNAGIPTADLSNL